MNIRQMLALLDIAGETYTWSSTHTSAGFTMNIEVPTHPTVMASVALNTDGTWNFSGATGMDGVERLASRELLGELVHHVESTHVIGALPSCAVHAKAFLTGDAPR